MNDECDPYIDFADLLEYASDDNDPLRPGGKGVRIEWRYRVDRLRQRSPYRVHYGTKFSSR